MFILLRTAWLNRARCPDGSPSNQAQPPERLKPSDATAQSANQLLKLPRGQFRSVSIAVRLPVLAVSDVASTDHVANTINSLICPSHSNILLTFHTFCVRPLDVWCTVSEDSINWLIYLLFADAFLWSIKSNCAVAAISKSYQQYSCICGLQYYFAANGLMLLF
jgi:hypothetical protein